LTIGITKIKTNKQTKKETKQNISKDENCVSHFWTSNTIIENTTHDLKVYS